MVGAEYFSNSAVIPSEPGDRTVLSLPTAAHTSSNVGAFNGISLLSVAPEDKLSKSQDRVVMGDGLVQWRSILSSEAGPRPPTYTVDNPPSRKDAPVDALLTTFVPDRLIDQLHIIALQSIFCIVDNIIIITLTVFLCSRLKCPLKPVSLCIVTSVECRPLKCYDVIGLAGQHGLFGRF